MRVLEKNDLVDYGDMVAQDALAPEAEVFGGSHARELPEIPDKVRLVKVSTKRRHVYPIRFGGPSHEHPGLLEPQHPAEQFRSQTDLCFKHLDKPALTQTDALGNALD
jgi:hypothetical protein